MRAACVLLLFLSAGLSLAEEASRCPTVPAALFRSLAPVVGSQPFDVISASGRQVGLFSRRSSHELLLRLLEKEKPAGQLFLKAPAGEKFTEDALYILAEGGQSVFVRERGYIAYYLGSSLVGLVPFKYKSGFFYRWPAIAKGKLYVSDKPWYEVGQRALLFAFEPDGSGQEELVRLEEKAFSADRPLLHNIELQLLMPVANPQGVLWLLRPYSGQVLQWREGKPKEVFNLESFAFRRLTEDPEVAKKMEEAVAKYRFLLEEEAHLKAMGDATAKPKKVTVEFTRSLTPLVLRAFALQDGLLLQLSLTQPQSAFVLAHPETGQLSCFALPKELGYRFDPLDPGPSLTQVAANDEGLWLAKPFGYLPWPSLRQWLEQQEEEKASPSASAHPQERVQKDRANP